MSTENHKQQLEQPQQEKHRRNSKIKSPVSTKPLMTVNLSYPNGDRYDGESSDNVPHGHGTYYWYYGGVTYKGDWLMGKREGKGKIDFPNNEFYEGDFRADKFNGHGTYYFFNGNKYVGEWKNGLEDGKGAFFYANGAKYEGRFRKGVFIGNEKDYFSDAGPKNLDDTNNKDMVFSILENKYVPVVKSNYVGDF